VRRRCWETISLIVLKTIPYICLTKYQPLILKVILTIIVSLFSLTLLGQITPSSQWTWMKGASTTNATASYGTLGVPSATNTPGPRSGSSSWADASGNFWIFGGWFSDGAIFNRYNDLWKFSPTTNQWTWMGGTNLVNQFGNYGSQGVASASNIPGGRGHSFFWTDASGNFWLFGGTGLAQSGGFGELTDLWKYDIITGQWTWVKGGNTINNIPIYGTIGIGTLSNSPGSRQQGTTWVDNSGNLWLYGGLGYGEDASYGIFADLWKYNIATNIWTWISGDKNTLPPATQGSYGTLGIASASNKPPSKKNAMGWWDNAGVLWLFGGDNTYGYYNDIWKYSISTNLWTWVRGNNLPDGSFSYGIKGTAASTNLPRPTLGGCTWTDANGFWFYGGVTEQWGGSGTGWVDKWLNDLWRYDPNSNLWTWINGDNSFNIYPTWGVQGIPSPSNQAGARSFPVSWKDNSNNFWLFSGNYGSSFNHFNDVWKLGRCGFTWIGVTSTDWMVGSNWCGGVVPGANDDAVVPVSTPFPAIVPSGVTTSVRSLTIVAGATVTVSTNAYLNVMH
jgi:hypothetical protein